MNIEINDDKKGIRIGIWIAILVIIVILLWALSGILLFWYKERGTFGDMFGAINALFSGLAFAGVIVALIFQVQEMKSSRTDFINSANEQLNFYAEERRMNTLQTTDSVFKDWWSDDMKKIRAYFFYEFLPNHWADLRMKKISLKKIDIVLKEDAGRVNLLTGFFDKVGWLGAANLIDVDYVLGPMQHVLNRVWYATEDFIKIERENESDHRLDPVYRLGFEWLFQRCRQRNHHQIDIIKSRFQNPTILSEAELNDLQIKIEEDEIKFKAYLDKLIDMNKK